MLSQVVNCSYRTMNWWTSYICSSNNIWTHKSIA